MVTSVNQVRCQCGKEYVLFADNNRLTIRCHMCGRLIDLSPFKAAATEREAAARTLAHQARVDHAARVNFAGLRFDGVYRTASPIPFDGTLAVAFELSLRFKSDLVVEYVFSAFDDDSPTGVDTRSSQTGYDVASVEEIRLDFDLGNWVCEWEGAVRGDTLELSHRIEEYFGISSGPKCVTEGEARLEFEHSSSGK